MAGTTGTDYRAPTDPPNLSFTPTRQILLVIFEFELPIGAPPPTAARCLARRIKKATRRCDRRAVRCPKLPFDAERNQAQL
jgi:hypothetical protein